MVLLLSASSLSLLIAQHDIAYSVSDLMFQLAAQWTTCLQFSWQWSCPYWEPESVSRSHLGWYPAPGAESLCCFTVKNIKKVSNVPLHLSCTDTAAGLRMLWQRREMSTCSARAQSYDHQWATSPVWSCHLVWLCFSYSEVCPWLQIFGNVLPYQLCVISFARWRCPCLSSPSRCPCRGLLMWLEYHFL